MSIAVEIKILDDNDKVPEVIFTSISTVTPKDFAPYPVIALFKTQDPDLGESGEKQENAPFRI